eukprot:CAMPEP_0170558898 /NCGR_PEP_ID=MMETSP0211-20121228/38770_1 /TAXON_ID=311385 /ORGANISM="Pseudokeronopsis sp., Strain OXSARD2" /LENGTH=53 /DNA_ID=CAMNT_0010871341 /DNA_START=636 /DNA_END=797 /DNA_ORIENTATION=-
MGKEIFTKVYPSTVIPDKNEIAYQNSTNKKNYRPNNFLSEAGFVSKQGHQKGG